MIHVTPNYLFIGSSERMKPEMRSETCDSCCRAVWLTPKAFISLDDAEDRDDRLMVLCVACGIREYGRNIVAQILLSQED